MSLSGVIAVFKTGSYTVTRSGAGAYVSGRYVAATPTTLSIDASVQPVSGRQLRTLPEAMHSDELRAVYTTTALYTRTPTQSPDTVSIDGADWEVYKTSDWTTVGSTHSVAIVSLITEQPDQSFVMQSSQEQSFQYTTASETDSYDITIPVAMTDTTYVVQATISTVPGSGVMAQLNVSNSGRTTSQFTLLCSGALKVGTVIDVIVRDRA